MKGKTAIIVAAVFMVVIVFVAVWAVQNSETNLKYNGTLIDPAAPAAEIALTHANGEVVRLSDYRGKVVLIYFGYTNCPDYCPTTMVNMRDTMEELGDLADEVVFFFVTIDPENDSPERMDDYVTIFNPAFFGLSGSEEELAKIWKDYGVFREKEGEEEEVADSVDHDTHGADGEEHELPSFGGVQFAHTSILYVIDKDGGWRLTIPWGMDPSLVVQDLRIIIAE